MPADHLSLPEELREELRALGTRLREARQRRGLTLASVAETLSIGEARLRRAEAGHPFVAVGVYAVLLDHYGLGTDVRLLAAPERDPVAKVLKAVRSGTRGGKR